MQIVELFPIRLPINWKLEEHRPRVNDIITISIIISIKEELFPNLRIRKAKKENTGSREILLGCQRRMVDIYYVDVN